MADIYLSEDQRKRRRRNLRIKIWLVLGLLMIFSAGGIYLIGTNGRFKIDVIETTGLQRSSSQQILFKIYSQLLSEVSGRLFGLDNYFVWPRKLKLNDPLIANLIVKKDFFNKKVALRFEERQPYGIFCNNSPAKEARHSCAWFDKTGYIFEPAPIPDGHLILTIVSDAEMNNPIGKLIVEERFIKPMFKILAFFTENEIVIAEYQINTKLQEVYVKIAGGGSARFSLRFDPDGSLSALRTIYEKNRLKNIDYIDLTVENRMYVKPR